MTEHDHDARQAERVPRGRRRRRWLLLAGLVPVLGLAAAVWWIFFPPVTSEERPLVGRWEVPHHAEMGYGTFEWEFKSNHTVRRRIVNPSGQVTMDDVLGWSVSEGKLVLVRRHSDWVWRLKSGNTTLTESGDADLIWDGPDRFAFVVSPQSKPFVLVRATETRSK